MIRRRDWLGVVLAAAVCGWAAAWGMDPNVVPGDAPREVAAADKKTGDPTDAARDRAKLLHQVYSATLHAMHEHYFRDDRAVIPARAMEDVFAEVAKETQTQARWIAVNTKAMSIHHEPKSDFEKQAAAALAAGKTEFEAVEKGVYFRAAPIPLTSGCIACHTGFFSGPPKTPRFAALVISVPASGK